MTTAAARKLNYNPAEEWAGLTREVEFRANVFVYKTISDVPWEEDSSEAFVGDVDTQRRIVEQMLTRRGEQPKMIPFNAERWMLDGVSISFKGLPTDLAPKVRKFVLYEVIHGRTPSFVTIKSHVQSIKRFCKLYDALVPGFYFRFVHADDVRRMLDGLDIPESGKKGMISGLCHFARFLQKNYPREKFGLTTEALEPLYDEYQKKDLSRRTSKKYCSIPADVFYPMHFKMMELIRDPMTPFNTAVTAAAVLVYMWTGLRPKEVRQIRRDSWYSVERDGRTEWFLRYISPKNKNRVQTVYLFAPALEALKALEALAVRHEVTHIPKYLVTFWEDDGEDPATSSKFSRLYAELLARHMSQELARTREGFSKTTVWRKTTIYKPNLYSFRVHLYTYLINKGFDERWVEQNLWHLAKGMRGYYYRMTPCQREEMKSTVKTSLPAVQQSLHHIQVLVDAMAPQETVSQTVTSIIELIQNS